AGYRDVARGPGGTKAMMRLMGDATLPRPPFAPPFLVDGEVMIAQTADILLYLGSRIGLSPDSQADQLFAHQLQLTIADLVGEAHDTHHPVGAGLYYADQKPESLRRAKEFREQRIG